MAVNVLTEHYSFN